MLMPAYVTQQDHCIVMRFCELKKKVHCESSFIAIIMVMIDICPYFATFRHKPEVIEKLEKAGLGYHVKAEQTKDQLGT